MRKLRLPAQALLLLALSSATFAQSPRPFPFHAVHYDVDATLNPADETIAARAKVDFVADEASRILNVELHQDLKIASVRGPDGAALKFDRNPDAPLTVKISLPDNYTIGGHVVLTFDYAGSLSSEDDSPTKGVRLASIERSGCYLLLPARWFPLTNYPANRYTAFFKITAPDVFAVVGTGKSAAPSIAPGHQVVYTFQNDQPAPVGTFVAGPLQLTPVQAQGLDISVYAPPNATAPANYGNALASVLNDYSGMFGPLPETENSFTIAQMPDGSLRSFFAPGVLLISARQWSAKADDRLLARLAAGEWWSDAVLPASPADVWLSDGLARYSEALYAEQAIGPSGMTKALEDCAIGALMYEDAAPIAQAQRLAAHSPEYDSVVVNKGAMVFHMLRSQIGPAAFQSLLHDFYAKYSGKNASLADFEALAASRPPAPAAAPAATPAAASAAPPTLNLKAFFSQWLDSTGIPEFKVDYIVYRTKSGFKVVGKVRQDLETFRMPVQVRVETEGNPETKTIEVAGTNSEFEIDTFGRPKANGLLLDPDNNLLKASGRLRVRAGISRGETQAEAGKYYEAIQDYQQALDLQPNNSLAHFRTGEAMFFQKNYQAAANAFRSALDGDLDNSYKWVEVWSHIYLGKIFDLTGQRERAVNEYTKAQQLPDDTGGAQAEAGKYIAKPYEEPGSATAQGATKPS